MHIIEFYFILFISVSVSADMKCPHIVIGRYAFFHIETALIFSSFSHDSRLTSVQKIIRLLMSIYVPYA